MSEPQSVLRELADLAAALGDTVVPPALGSGLESVTATARRFFGAAACSIAAFDEDGEELHYVAATGEGAGAIVGVRLPIDRGIAGWVAQSGQALAVSDLSNDRRFARDVAESTSYVPTALLAAPIESGDRLLGVLTVLDRETARAGAAADLDSVSLFAGQAAVLLEARAAFADAGRVLLDALARAAGSSSPLATPLTEALADVAAGTRRDPGLQEFAALLAQLYRAGPDARRLGVDVLRSVLAFDARTSRSSSFPRS